MRDTEKTNATIKMKVNKKIGKKFYRCSTKVCDYL